MAGKRGATHGERAERTSPSAETLRKVLHVVLEDSANRQGLLSAMPNMYQTCKTWRNKLVHDKFFMRTFSLCRALAAGNGAQTLQRVQATIARQIGRLPDQDERAWWLDARSLVQRCDFRDGSGTVWSWLQAASQEPDGPLSKEAAATAEMLGKQLVCWPDKPQVRFPGMCTLRGHSGDVFSVAYSPDGEHIVIGSADNTVKVWDAQTGKEVRVLHCHRPIVCCCEECSDLRDWSMSRSARSVILGIVLSLIPHIYIAGVQIRTFGHTGEGNCICTCDEDGFLEIGDECPV